LSSISHFLSPLLTERSQTFLRIHTPLEYVIATEYSWLDIHVHALSCLNVKISTQSTLSFLKIIWFLFSHIFHHYPRTTPPPFVISFIYNSIHTLKCWINVPKKKTLTWSDPGQLHNSIRARLFPFNNYLYLSNRMWSNRKNYIKIARKKIKSEYLKVKNII